MQVSRQQSIRQRRIKPGDIILEFDGKPINVMKELPKIVAETDVGKVLLKFGEINEKSQKKLFLED